MNIEEINSLCDAVRECSFGLHKHLKHGHLEKIYENGLAHRLKKRSITVEQQAPVPVYDEDGTILGDMKADPFVADELIVELKAVRAVNDDHVSQLLGYLRGSGKRYGLLINCGSPKLHIKRYILDPISES
jgi:GxxExxY protein